VSMLNQMTRPTTTVAVASWNSRPLLQRKCVCGQHSAGGQCDQCRRKGKNSDRLVQDVLRSPGIPLGDGTRAFFESRLPSPRSKPPSGIQSKSQIVPSTDSSEREAHQVSEGIVGRPSYSGAATKDLSQVRVHADGSAAESARAIHADAYAAGSHLVFAQGKFSPQTRDGQKLLAHELTHVLQQEQAGSALNANPALQRQDDGSGSDDDDNKKPGEEKPKSSAEPEDPDSTGISLKYEKGKLVYCGSILGHEVCSDTPEKVKEAMKKMGKKKPPFIPDDSKCPGRMNPMNGKCCPENQLWDDEKKKCAPMLKEQPTKCAPFEWPNTLYPGCCKPGDDKPGCHRVPGPIIPSPDAPVKPPSGDVTGTPNVTPAVAQPPTQTILHFQFDMPSPSAGKDEATLLKSLVPEDRGKWSSLLADLEKNPAWKFQLVGHASPEGDKNYNHGLGERRALLVKSVLDAKKIGGRVVDVKPECDFVSNGIYNCGEKDATGPEDRQVKVLFDQSISGQAQPKP
jgi:uncharacterized protein DUF4157